MRADIIGLVKPAGLLEEVCVQEVADLIWQVKRLRRLKVSPIRATTRRLLQETLRPIVYSDRQPGSASEDYPDERLLAVGWAAGEGSAAELRRVAGEMERAEDRAGRESSTEPPGAATGAQPRA